MVEYVNMIMRNEDVQGKEEKFGTWKASLDASLFEAENKRMTWAEAKRHRVEIWLHDTETDELMVGAKAPIFLCFLVGVQVVYVVLNTR